MSIPTYQVDLIEKLTKRQGEVLVEIARGRTNQEISQQLHISISTVEGHTRAIYQQLGARSRTEAALISQYASLLGKKKAEEKPHESSIENDGKPA